MAASTLLPFGLFRGPWDSFFSRFCFLGSSLVSVASASASASGAGAGVSASTSRLMTFGRWDTGT
jgi:hypothetical protein